MLCSVNVPGMVQNACFKPVDMPTFQPSGRRDKLAYIDGPEVFVWDVRNKCAKHTGLLQHANVHGIDRLHALDCTGWRGFDDNIQPVEVYCAKSVFTLQGADNQSARDCDIQAVGFGCASQPKCTFLCFYATLCTTVQGSCTY